MNQIKDIFTRLTEAELIELLTEMRIADDKGYYENDSKVRDLCREVAEITGMDLSSNLMHTQMQILKEAAYRWHTTKTVGAQEERLINLMYEGYNDIKYKREKSFKLTDKLYLAAYEYGVGMARENMDIKVNRRHLYIQHIILNAQPLNN